MLPEGADDIAEPHVDEGPTVDGGGYVTSATTAAAGVGTGATHLAQPASPGPQPHTLQSGRCTGPVSRPKYDRDNSTQEQDVNQPPQQTAIDSIE